MAKKGNNMAYFKNENKDIVIGTDIPYWSVDYYVNEDKLKLLDNNEAVVTGYLMWSLVQSGLISPDEFDTTKNEDRSFGLILVAINKITGLCKPEEYEETLNIMKIRDSITKKQLDMLGSCFFKIANALAMKYKIKIVKG